MKRSLYSADHDSYRSMLRAYLTKEVQPRIAEFIEARAFPRELWIEAGKHGLLGLNVPEEYGGGGAGDYRYSAVQAEELAKITMALASCVGIHSEVVAPYLVDLTTPEQKERWLPRFCTGELLTAIGMTEPSGGSDLKALKTTAVRDGDDWMLNGAKTFITNGYSADLIVVAARTREAGENTGITLFAVESGMDGFSRGRKLDKVGQDEADTAELIFENVVVPDANRLGEVGAGFGYMMERLPQERLGAALANTAHAAQILEETIEYAKDRKAFGQPIGAFQSIKFRIAEMATQIEVTRAYLDQCVIAHDRRELTSVDAATAKWWSSHVQNEVLDDCVQIYGGYGYMNEYRAARAWRDARVTRIWAGSNEIMKEIIGRDLGL
ncbi:acyl-CoA dehydrogenase family protein [Hoyosella subflava]|uniref:Long-chain-acyl-CoA dehydrogenase n=1 Tax=Hoyosella subflava (strain DSM 45089 / JCM 17490 / NBRC 109087 / DQS3-9A1) TaxID=443218 RepID=F6ELX0_HOYSD|nr:acyl-CoA dehydrogenase family protein [Hoyosella subflava]AEF42751.1 Long-chain-acyl-CoA dehydrogenase [Hoyosella subflava DQS3-9A1]